MRVKFYSCEECKRAAIQQVKQPTPAKFFLGPLQNQPGNVHLALNPIAQFQPVTANVQRIEKKYLSPARSQKVESTRSMGVSGQGQASLPAQEMSPEEAMCELYKRANSSGLEGSDSSHTISRFILENFDALACSENGSSTLIPEPLQEAIVVLIMSGKKEGDLSITQHDIFTALDTLKEASLNSDTKLAEKIGNYMACDLEFLLADGVRRYNDNPQNLIRKGNVTLNAKLLVGILDEINSKIIEDLSLWDTIHWSQTCKSFPPFSRFDKNDTFWRCKLISLKDNEEAQKVTENKKTKEIFFEHPEYRRFAQDLMLDQKGRNYFAKTLGCGFVMVHKVGEGECSVEEVLQRREEILAEVDKKIAEGNHRNLDANDLACLINGALTFEQVQSGIYITSRIANEPCFYKYFVNGKLKNDQFRYFSVEFLSDSWVQQQLDNEKLTIEDCLELSPMTLQTGWDVLRKKMHKLDYGRLVLLNPDVQKMIDENQQSIKLVIKVLQNEMNNAWGNGMISLLSVDLLVQLLLTLADSKWLCQKLEDEVFTNGLLPIFNKGGIKFLCDPKVQEAMDACQLSENAPIDVFKVWIAMHNSSELNVDGFIHFFKKITDSQWLCQKLNSHVFDLDIGGNLASGVIQVVLNHDIQRAMDNKKIAIKHINRELENLKRSREANLSNRSNDNDFSQEEIDACIEKLLSERVKTCSIS